MLITVGVNIWQFVGGSSQNHVLNVHLESSLWYYWYIGPLRQNTSNRERIFKHGMQFVIIQQPISPLSFFHFFPNSRRS